MGGAPHQHAAMIVIRADVRALLLARNEHRIGLRLGVDEIDLLLHAVIVRLAPGAEEIARLGPAAIDLVVGDQVLDVGEGVDGVIEEGLGFFRRERPVDHALADIDARRDKPAGACRSTEAGLGRVEDNRVDPVPGQFEGGIHAGVATADDRHRRFLRQCHLRQGLRLIGLPPKGLRLEIRVENCL